MKTSLVVTLTVLFLIVAGTYSYFNSIEIKEAEIQSTSMRLLPLQKEDAITEIQIDRTGNEPVVLEVVEGEWLFKKPVESPADALITNGLASALTLSSKARRLTRQKEWKEYGLEKPEVRIGVKTKKNPKQRFLALGDPSPVGEYLFARWEDEEDYFLLNADLKKVFSLSTYAMRDKKIFRDVIQKWSHLYLRTPLGNFELAEHGAGRWFWMEPILILGESVAAKDVDKIKGLVEELYVKDFLDDENRSRRELGISSTGHLVRVWGADQKQETLLLGEEIPARDSYVGVREGGDTYFLVARGNVAALFQTVQSLAKERMNQTSAPQKAP